MASMFAQQKNTMGTGCLTWAPWPDSKPPKCPRSRPRRPTISPAPGPKAPWPFEIFEISTCLSHSSLVALVFYRSFRAYLQISLRHIPKLIVVTITLHSQTKSKSTFLILFQSFESHVSASSLAIVI